MQQVAACSALQVGYTPRERSRKREGGTGRGSSSFRAGFLCAALRCTPRSWSHNVPVSFLTWVFPAAVNWLKTFLLTPNWVLRCSRKVIPARGAQPSNWGTKKHGDVYFGMLWLLVTNPAKPLGPGMQLGLGFAFCKLAGDRIAIPFSHSSSFFVLRTPHHSRDWMLGQQGKAEVPSPGADPHPARGSVPHSAFPDESQDKGLQGHLSLCFSFMSFLLYLRIISPLHLLGVMLGCYQIKWGFTATTFTNFSPFNFFFLQIHWLQTNKMSSYLFIFFPQPSPVSGWGNCSPLLYSPWTHSNFRPSRPEDKLIPRLTLEAALSTDELESGATWRLHHLLYGTRNKEFYWFKSALFVRVVRIKA